MKMVKVYDADGKKVDSFNKDVRNNMVGIMQFGYNTKILFLNKNGFYIKGQTTSKGVKIK